MQDNAPPGPKSPQKIRAIETEYAGCRFRSRLEARWAVFMDTLEIDWRYEHEAYALHSGGYLPDFYLPSMHSYIEVKGVEPTPIEEALADELTIATDATVYIAFGDIPRDGQTSQVAGTGFRAYFPDGAMDHPYFWCACPWCGKFGIEYDGRGSRVCGFEAHGRSYDDKGYDFDNPRINMGYEIARSMRFEPSQGGR